MQESEFIFNHAENIFFVAFTQTKHPQTLCLWVFVDDNKLEILSSSMIKQPNKKAAQCAAFLLLRASHFWIWVTSKGFSNVALTASFMAPRYSSLNP